MNGRKAFLDRFGSCKWYYFSFQSKRGTKGMSLEIAQELAKEYVGTAHSTEGDALTNLGQARIMMDTVIVLPSPPVKILMEVCLRSSPLNYQS